MSCSRRRAGNPRSSIRPRAAHHQVPRGANQPRDLAWARSSTTRSKTQVIHSPLVMSSPYGDRSGDALARRSVEIEVLMEVPAEELKEFRPAVSWSLAYHER